MAETFKYFAYGSNMLSHRLMARCDSARLTTVASAIGYKIEFSKPSIDNSGKATLIHTGVETDIATGAVFEIAADQADALDTVEGPGYVVHDPFHVTCNRTSEVISARTYIANKHKDNLAPYDWYLALVLAGIAEHELDDEYQAIFRATSYREDADLDRRSRRDALAVLELAGISDYRVLL